MWLIRLIAAYLGLPYNVTEISDGVHSPKTIEVSIGYSVTALKMAREARAKNDHG